MSQSGTLFCGKAHRHILFILQNIERRGGGGGGGGGIYPFLLEKKIRNQNSVERIRVTAIQVLSSKRVQLSDEYVSF